MWGLKMKAIKRLMVDPMVGEVADIDMGTLVSKSLKEEVKEL